MGKYTFTWEHSAHEVFVTGTFDDWRKTVKLEKEDGIFKKTVELPKTHTQYKFVVNGNWCINESARKEDDGHGITNNVLLPEDFVDEPVHTHSSAAPESTTAALAGSVPKEEKSRSDDSLVPGAFPQTPAAETPLSEAQTFNVNPLPATSGLGNPIKLAAGEPVPDPSTFTDNTVHSTVKHDKEPEEATTFGVAPIPATAGAGNPIHLAPGEKVPHPSTFTDNTVNSTAKTDPSSYEKSDALPPLAFTPQAEREAKGGMFGLPPVMGNMIPESSLPMGVDAKTEKDTGIHIQSAAPSSTTAALAGQVPKEPRGVPEAVTESQKEAGFAPEAAANSDAVQEKKEVEQELKEKVPEAPAAADNSYASNISSTLGGAATTAVAGATAGAGLFTAAVVSAKDKTAEATGLDSSATAGDVKDKAAEAVGLNSSAPADDIPDVPVRVIESQQEAHISPEAASNVEAVHEKSQVEQELLSEIPKTNETGTSAPAIAIPAIVSESQKEAHVGPEAAANTFAVADKKAMESELLSEIPKANEAGEPAPAISAATIETAPGANASHVANTESVAREVPEVVAESQKEAHASPEAATNAEAVSEKKAVETELLSEVKTTNATGEPAPVAAATTSTSAAGLSDEALVDSKPLKSSSEPDALNAPASKPAQPLTSKPIDSNTDVAFAGKEPTTTEQTKPVVTTGTETTTTEAKSDAPAAAAPAAAPETPRKDVRKDSDVSPKGTPGSQSIASGADDKKKKRRSIFGKLKEKFSSKH
ncbi:Cruciform DNA binding protein [Neocucurbitaria cava]|uniref:Cruciform DNA binding protein n=1 Tax=Neocucurbitaria cava TaxID=798079 RepID=A0A9W9CND0_9PLEO|nr:Cruciform DNA binding protein [Neocucurbitaria cava]